MAEKLRALNNHVLLKLLKEDTKTPGGLVIAGGAEKGAQTWRCEVLDIGPGTLTAEPLDRVNESGDIVYEFACRPTSPDIGIGDVVYIPAFNGYKTYLGMEEFLLCKDSEILAVVERDA